MSHGCCPIDIGFGSRPVNGINVSILDDFHSEIIITYETMNTDTNATTKENEQIETKYHNQYKIIKETKTNSKYKMQPQRKS